MHLLQDRLQEVPQAGEGEVPFGRGRGASQDAVAARSRQPGGLDEERGLACSRLPLDRERGGELLFPIEEAAEQRELALATNDPVRGERHARMLEGE